MALRPANARFMGMGGHSMEHAIGEAAASPSPRLVRADPPEGLASAQFRWKT